MRLIKFTCLVAFLIGFSACNSETASTPKTELPQASSSAPIGDELFEAEKKEGCSSEEDLEKKLVEASKEGASLQGSTDCVVQ